jgi:formate dehydrogenase alpha subunit
MTNSIAEIPEMEVLFLIGTNTKESHPVIANQMIKAKRRGAKIILADPRRVPMVRFADLVLQLKPGTDLALLNGIAHVIVAEGLHDDAFIADRTEGFDELRASLAAFAPETVAAITGVPADAIRAAARIYGASRKAGIFYTMGITQHAAGTDNVKAIANLALLTGNVGRPATGVNPLRGQNNVQGSSDAAALPNVLPGYQPVNSPEVRRKFETAWAVRLPETAGMMATEMIPAAREGRLKALYIMGENPIISDPNANYTVTALKKLDFLVVQDIFLTETAQLADVVLPAACFAEKDGTFTNTERKVQRLRKAVNPPGEARDDLSVLNDISRRLGYVLGCGTPEDTLDEFRSLWEPLAGITYQRLERSGIAWPCPSTDHPGTPYLYAHGFARGKAPFSVLPFLAPEEGPDDAYPFILTTGRNLFQYHTGSMTRRVQPIELHAGTPYVELHPDDARQIGIAEGDSVSVASRRGSITVRARITRRVDSGVVFIPMHYREAAANVLTTDSADRTTKTPEFKVCAVKIEAGKK